MTTMKNEINDDYHSKSWMNLAKKGYFYLGRGLAELNNWKNLFIGIIGLCIAVKIESIWIMAVIFAISIPLLILAGYIMVHRISRMMDYLSIKFGSHFATRNFDYVEGQYELMKEIRDMMIENRKLTSYPLYKSEKDDPKGIEKLD